jgi:hypothetical protein
VAVGDETDPVGSEADFDLGDLAKFIPEVLDFLFDGFP